MNYSLWWQQPKFWQKANCKKFHKCLLTILRELLTQCQKHKWTNNKIWIRNVLSMDSLFHRHFHCHLMNNYTLLNVWSTYRTCSLDMAPCVGSIAPNFSWWCNDSRKTYTNFNIPHSIVKEVLVQVKFKSLLRYSFKMLSSKWNPE